MLSRSDRSGVHERLTALRVSQGGGRFPGRVESSRYIRTGCGAVWLARLSGGQEVGSSNLPSPTDQSSWSGMLVVLGESARDPVVVAGCGSAFAAGDDGVVAAGGVAVAADHGRFDVGGSVVLAAENRGIGPSAMFWRPPSTDAWSPLAVLRSPPETDATGPPAELAWPPDTDAKTPFAWLRSFQCPLVPVSGLDGARARVNDEGPSVRPA